MKKPTNKNLTKEIAQELDVFDEMLSALVELLEEKGILTQKEWESKIKKRIEEKREKERIETFNLVNCTCIMPTYRTNSLVTTKILIRRMRAQSVWVSSELANNWSALWSNHFSF